MTVCYFIIYHIGSNKVDWTGNYREYVVSLINILRGINLVLPKPKRWRHAQPHRIAYESARTKGRLLGISTSCKTRCLNACNCDDHSDHDKSCGIPAESQGRQNETRLCYIPGNWPMLYFNISPAAWRLSDMSCAIHFTETESKCDFLHPASSKELYYFEKSDYFAS